MTVVCGFVDCRARGICRVVWMYFGRPAVCIEKFSEYASWGSGPSKRKDGARRHCGLLFLICESSLSVVGRYHVKGVLK